MSYELRTAIRAALDELGVPGVGYPAPVANAVNLLNAALVADQDGPHMVECGGCEACDARYLPGETT